MKQQVPTREMLMAKTVQSDEIALTALAAFLGDPTPRILHGSKKAPGVFAAAGAKEKAAANLCLERGWLQPTGLFEGTGKSRKETYRITAEGVQAVLSRTDSSAQLASLNAGLEKLAAAVNGTAQNIETQVGKLLDEFQTSVRQALKPLEAVAALPDVQRNIVQVLERVQPPDVATLLQKLSAVGPTSQPARADWKEDVIRLATEQKQKNPFQLLTLPQVFEQLRVRHANLSLSEYHDGLRDLHRAHRIRLGPYTQALATLDDGQNALYLDREVKYYVELA